MQKSPKLRVCPHSFPEITCIALPKYVQRANRSITAKRKIEIDSVASPRPSRSRSGAPRWGRRRPGTPRWCTSLALAALGRRRSSPLRPRSPRCGTSLAHPLILAASGRRRSPLRPRSPEPRSPVHKITGAAARPRNPASLRRDHLARIRLHQAPGCDLLRATRHDLRPRTILVALL